MRRGRNFYCDICKRRVKSTEIYSFPIFPVRIYPHEDDKSVPNYLEIPMEFCGECVKKCVTVNVSMEESDVDDDVLTWIGPAESATEKMEKENIGS